MLKGVFFSLLTLLLHLAVSPSNGLNVLEINELDNSNRQKTDYVARIDYLRLQQHWIDSLVKDMTLEEKIGQLFITYTHIGQNEIDVENLVKEQHIGGIVFSKGSPTTQLSQTNRYQTACNIPLLIGINSEFGLSAGLDSVSSLPNVLTAKAIQNEELIRQTGYEVGRQCKRLGVHFSLGMTDSLTNSSLLLAYTKGLAEKGVIHFVKNYKEKHASIIGISMENNVFKKGIAQVYGQDEILVAFEKQDLIITNQVVKNIAKIKEAIEEGKISKQDIDKKIQNALRAKFATLSFGYKSLSTTNVVKDLNTPEAIRTSNYTFKK